MANDESAEMPPKRRRLQFSLKLLLVLIGIMAILFASIRRPYNQLLKERKVAAKVNELKGTVTWKGFGREGGGMVWPYVAMIDLSLKEVTDDDLKKIGSLKKLNRLMLDGTQVSDAGLAHLTNLQQLQSISLARTPTTNEGLKSIAALSKLESLLIFESQITAEGMSIIGGMPQLSTLIIDNTVATDSGVGHLKSLPNLEGLTIVGKPAVSDEVLLELRDQVTVQWVPANGGTVQTIRHKFPLRKKQQKNSGPQDTSS